MKMTTTTRCAWLALSVLLAAASCQCASVLEESQQLQPPPSSPTIATKLIREGPLSLPDNQPLCHVQRVEARKAGGGGDGGGGDGAFVEVGEGGGADALLKHVAHFTQLDDLATTPTGAKGQLRYPENLEFVRVNQHFWSCVDPRARYGVLGTLGGDIGEFINAMAVMEDIQQRIFYMEDVSSMMQEYVRTMHGRGKTKFYMHTDEAALKAIGTAAGASDPLKPDNTTQRNALIALATKPEHIGCQHLKGMVSTPAEYGVRKELVEYAIKSFLNVFYDDTNPLRDSFLYVVSQGELVKAPLAARVWSPDSCPGIAPLLVPNTGQSQSTVHHKAHVAFFRQDLSRFFAFKNAIIDPLVFFKKMQALSKKQEAHLKVYTETEETDVIFTSLWDRWPF